MFNTLNRLRRRSLLLILSAGLLAACGSDDEAATGSGGVNNPPPAAAAKKLYVFGDSLSDAGNLGDVLPFGATLPAPFYMNRISNGPVIVDHIAQSLGLTLSNSDFLSTEERGTNYAVSGARAFDSDPVDLAVQIESFTAKNNGRADPAANYIVFIGGNDVLGSVGNPASTAMLDSAVDEIVKAVQALILLGARNVYVFNVPDIGRTPKLISQEAAGDVGSVARASDLSRYFNQQLATRVGAIAAPGVTLTQVDIFGIFDQLLANAASSGFTDSTRPCYETSAFQFAAYCNQSLLDSFIFFDTIHPSGRTHRLIGEEVVRRIGASLI